MATKQQGKKPKQYIPDLLGQFLWRNTHADRVVENISVPCFPLYCRWCRAICQYQTWDCRTGTLTLGYNALKLHYQESPVLSLCEQKLRYNRDMICGNLASALPCHLSVHIQESTGNSSHGDDKIALVVDQNWLF